MALSFLRSSGGRVLMGMRVSVAVARVFVTGPSSGVRRVVMGFPCVVSAAGSVQRCHYPAFLPVGKAAVSERVRWLHECPPVCFRHF